MKNSEKQEGWDQFSLDERIKRAIYKLNWSKPTAVQEIAVPYALKGKDVLVKAKTGSGKTAAYLIPVIQRILTTKEGAVSNPYVHAIILVPTTELAHQVHSVVNVLCYYLSHIISSMKITADEQKETQEPRLKECPDIIIATPGRIVNHLESGTIRLTRLQMVVIDEADLVMSFGYKSDLDKLKAFLPSVCQGFLMSATLSDDVTAIKKLILHTPVVLEVEEQEPSKLKQYVISCNTTDKFLIFYVLLKLRLLLGKSLVFVNTIERCFQLKLFLERLSIPSAVLNSDLPQNSRHHIVHDFNCGIFDILIATDATSNPDNLKLKKKASQQLQKGTAEKSGANSDDSDLSDSDDDLIDGNGSDLSDEEENSNLSDEEKIAGEKEGKNAGLSEFEENPDEILIENDDQDPLEKMTNENAKNQKNSKKILKLSSNAKHEYGVSRGIDFLSVSNVINFDFPTTVEGYVHRVGRTARAKNAGAALSFVAEKDSEILEEVKKQQESQGQAILPHKFKMSVIEGFRYRVEGILGSVTRRSIKEARIEEIKAEILNSQKLTSQLKPDNNELRKLKHDKTLQKQKIRKHLRHVPFYLLPKVQEDPLTPNVKNPYKRYYKYRRSLKSSLRTFNISKKGRGFKRPYKHHHKKKKHRIDKPHRSNFKHNRPTSF